MPPECIASLLVGLYYWEGLRFNDAGVAVTLVAKSVRLARLRILALAG